MKLAAIDIGSNAVRLQITRVIEFEGISTFKKLEYIRFPLRLGNDVFTTGRIGESNVIRFVKLMTAFKNIIDLYEVNAYYGCATSAMREAMNGLDIIHKIKNDLNLNIEIISGEKEAEMINEVISHYLTDGAFVHIDVGGGSTELNFYFNAQKILSESFRLGSVRSLNHADTDMEWKRLNTWIEENVHSKFSNVQVIATGGNINKLFELSGGKKQRRLSRTKLEAVQTLLKSMTLEQRMSKLQLNPDRADVIIPASEIYLNVMKELHTRSIGVPDVGLKDGINFHLYKQFKPAQNRVVFKNSML